MLYFRDYDWLLVNGFSRFHAYITPAIKTRQDVTWFLDLRYIATGPAWRRVFPKPTVWLSISSFRPPAASWRDLEQLSFWNLPPGREEDWSPFRERGSLDFAFYPNRKHDQDEVAHWMDDHLWRIAARDGRWFTLEMALLPDDYDPAELQNLTRLVTSSGEEISDDSRAHWKERAELYLIENIPFGTVTVRAPRNARDLERYALARAQELIGGLGEPEHIELNDHSNYEKASEDLQRDIFVELHYHGHYER